MDFPIYIFILFLILLQIIKGDESFKPDGIFPPDYNKYVSPSQKGFPTHVFLDLSVMDIDRIDDGLMEFSIQSYLIEFWTDYRLNLSRYVNDSELNTLFPKVLEQYIWTPDLVFDNAKSGTLFSLSVPNTQVRISNKGVLMRSTRYNIVIGCRMNFHYYPMDTQKCFLKIASMANPEPKVVLHWSNEKTNPVRKKDSIRFTNDIQPLTYRLHKPKPYRTRELWSAGNYTYLYANFTFSRRVSGSVLNVYIPSALVVLLSWISFWLDVGAVPARITLGVTSVLTLATQMVQTRSGLPPISYMTALDVWLFCCLFAVFASILEYAFSYQLYFSRTQKEARPDLHPRLRKSPRILVVQSVLLRPKVMDARSSISNILKEQSLDYYSRRLFPLVFITFAVAYWAYYLAII